MRSMHDTKPGTESDLEIREAKKDATKHHNRMFLLVGSV